MKKVIIIKGVDGDVWEEFKLTVASKYGKFYGKLGLELSKAIKLYIENFQKECCTHTQTPKIYTFATRVDGGERNNKSKTIKNLEKIVMRIKSLNEITQNELEWIITEVAGGDNRTINRYIEMLENKGIISPDRLIFNTNKFIYKIMKEGIMERKEWRMK